MASTQQELPRISVFGLGKLGAVVAACHAQRGFQVVGFDVTPETVETVKRGVPPVRETGLDALFEEAGPNLTATLDATDAVRNSDVTMIVVPTPSQPDGGYALRYVLGACESIGKALQEKSAYHLVVLKSTVMPGASEAEIVPALEKVTGKRAGLDFGYCYNPEFIALGSVVRNIFEPDLVLIGETDERAGDMLERIYERLLEIPANTSRMNCVNAELAKLALNSYVTMKVTFANLLACLCERLPGGDVNKVTGAIGRDSRVGPKYLRGGLGYGGPCFPRDNKAIVYLAEELGVPFALAEATDRANTEVTLRVVDLVASRAEPPAAVAVLGLSYKPDTPVVTDSQGLLLARTLAERGFQVSVYDPQALENARETLGDSVHYATSTADCVRDADAVLLCTAWPEFERIPEVLRPLGRSPWIVDCWGMLGASENVGDRVVRLGVGSP